MKSFPLMRWLPTACSGRDGNGSVLLDSFGLAKKERITNAKEFEHAYKNGAISKSGCLLIRSLSNNLGYSRLGIAVSKKLFPSAVTRNRIKRLIREAFRLNKQQLPKGIDLIVGVRSFAIPLRRDDGKGLKPFTLPEIQAGLMGLFAG